MKTRIKRVKHLHVADEAMIRDLLKPVLDALAALRSDVAQLRAEARTNEGATMNAMDRITQEVTETRGAISSLKALLVKLSDYIKANSNDPGKLEALADSLQAGQDEVAQAIADNPVPGEVIGTPEPGTGGGGEPEPGTGSGEPETPPTT